MAIVTGRKMPLAQLFISAKISPDNFYKETVVHSKLIAQLPDESGARAQMRLTMLTESTQMIFWEWDIANDEIHCEGSCRAEFNSIS